MPKRSILLLTVLIFTTFINGESFQCSTIYKNANTMDKNTIVDTTMKTLMGTWASEGCETRPGPEYVLRHYSFYENGMVKLIQHHYWDDSCSFPKLTIILKGQLKTRRDSFLHHDALTGNINPINISIIPYNFEATKELKLTVSCQCGGQYWDTWTRLEEHLIFSNSEPHFYGSKCLKHDISPDPKYFTRIIKAHFHEDSTNIRCLGSLRWTFDELKLIKVQLRPNAYFLTDSIKEMHWELLLGDIPSRSNIRDGYIPTAFQVPLVKISKGETILYKNKKIHVKYSCHICSKILANEKIPHSLIAKPRLPVFIKGEWVSQRCEIRPMGLYLTRQFSFYDDDWIGDHKFFKDPFCIFPKFFVIATGKYEITETNRELREAQNIDFKIETANLAIFDRHMVKAMSTGACGEYEWKIAVPQELSATYGCAQLGIVIPSILHDIVKIEMNYEGSWLLFLGQADTENKRITADSRPTAFQTPLVRCGVEPDLTESTNRCGSNTGWPQDPMERFLKVVDILLVISILWYFSYLGRIS